MDKIRLSESKYSIRYSYDLKKRACEEYLSGNFTKREIWKKYTGNEQEHGSLLKWLRELGYVESKQRIIFVPPMYKNKEGTKIESPQDNQGLKRRIKELEKQLEEAEMKAFAYSTMIDVAEEELKIPIRKK